MTTPKNNKSGATLSDCWNTIGVWGRAENRCEKLNEFVHCRNCSIFSDVGRSVFERRAPSKYLTHWRKRISGKKNTEADSKGVGALVFRVKNEWFALPSKVINVIANNRAIHRIPRNQNPFITGVVNINGEIKTCYSFDCLLNISDIKDTKSKIDKLLAKRFIVVKLGSQDYVFPVDEIMGLSWYSDVDMIPAPATLDINKLSLIHGSIKKDKKQVAIFNVQMLQEKLEGKF